MVSNNPGSFCKTGILDFGFLGISWSVIRVSLKATIAKLKVKVFLFVRVSEAYTFSIGF